MKLVLNNFSNELHKVLRLILFSSLILVFLEISLFNIKFWITLKNKEINAFDYCVSNEKNYLEFRNFDMHISNILIDAENTNGNKVKFIIYMNDAANDNDFGMKCEETSFYNKYKRGKHFVLHSNGKSKWLKIHFTDNEANIKINGVKFNPKIPFHFSLVRFSFLLTFSIFFIIFRPHSVIYDKTLFPLNKKKLIFLSFLVLFCMSVSVVIGNLIKPSVSIKHYIEHGWPAYDQYTELADAIISGQVFLHREPPKSLANAQNPYDGRQRWEAVVINGNERFEYDYAYFEGKYYTYFGIVPALVFFVPYKLITGKVLHTWHPVLFLSVFYCFLAFWFVYELSKKYFKKVSLGIYILCSLFLISASSVVYLNYVGNTYSLPIISSLCLGLCGLSFWLKCSSLKKINKIPLALGSIFIALILGCRPQLILVFLLAIPIFLVETITERLFFSKKGVINTLIIMAPFVVIGICLGFYNYIRFHSFFDFGANYNLTANDMTHRGWVWSRIPLAFFTYFLQPIVVSARFPFLNCNAWENNYLGYTYYEPIFGGLLWYNILFGINFFLFRFRTALKDKKLILFPIMLCSIGLIIMSLDANVAGLTQRYASDFSWLFAISTIILLLLLNENRFKILQTEAVFFARRLLFFCISSSLILNIWSVFIIGRYFSLIDERPSIFYYMKDICLFF